jgi:ribosome-binding factor A
MTAQRELRLGRLIQQKIGGLIVRGKIKDPRVDSFLTVTHVEVSRDASYADVFISSYKTVEGLHTGVAGLKRAAPFIQAKLNEELRLRETPRLRFHADTGIRESFELNQKIDELVLPPSQ